MRKILTRANLNLNSVLSESDRTGLLVQICPPSPPRILRKFSFAFRVRLDDFPKPSKVGASDVWVSVEMPALGLEGDATSIRHLYRVYVIECANGCWYVGIVHKDRLKERLLKHWACTAAHYTKVNVPRRIHLILPARNKAVEAYVYYALLERMPVDSARRLGGWVQTSTNPSALGHNLVEQARRCMHELCFNCGVRRWVAADHKGKKECPRPLQGAPYQCPSEACKAKILVTTRGHAELAPTRARLQVVAAPQAATPAGAAVKRAAALTPAQPIPKRTRIGSVSAGKEVDVCGARYTSISWFLNTANPSPTVCAHVERTCKSDAVELRGGHVRSLVKGGYAAGPNVPPKPLPVLCRMVRSGRGWVQLTGSRRR